MKIVEKKKYEYEYTIGRFSDGRDKEVVKHIMHEVLTEDENGLYRFHFDHDPTFEEVLTKFNLDKKDISDDLWKLKKRVEEIEKKLKDKGV